MTCTKGLVVAAAAICIASASAFAQNADWRAAYKEAFYKQARSTLQRLLRSSSEMKGASSEVLAEAADGPARMLSECHMIALSAYSAGLQQTAFNAIKEGGSYADAKLAFESALAAEGVAGGEGRIRAKKMLEAATKAGEECMRKAR